MPPRDPSAGPQDHWALQWLFGISPDPAVRAKDLRKVYAGLIAGVFVLGVSVVAAFEGSRAGLPDKSALVEITGTIDQASERNGTIDFTLRGREDRFRYNSKAGGSDVVFVSLRRNANVKLWHERPAADYDAGRHKLDVFQIAVGERMIKSYEEVEQSWLADNRLILWIAAGSALGVTYLLAYIWLARRKAFRERSR